MADSRPNIVLFMTDEQRGDCLGIDGHPVLQTPYLDELAAAGTRFRHAYSACPVCGPARRTLMSGRKPASHGVLMNAGGLLDGPTLPGELSRAGYQTHLVGKLHLSPRRKLYGFHSSAWADSPLGSPGSNDYQLFLAREGVRGTHGRDADAARHRRRRDPRRCGRQEPRAARHGRGRDPATFRSWGMRQSTTLGDDPLAVHRRLSARRCQSARPRRVVK